MNACTSVINDGVCVRVCYMCACVCVCVYVCVYVCVCVCVATLGLTCRAHSVHSTQQTDHRDRRGGLEITACDDDLLSTTTTYHDDRFINILHFT